jgi:hypothetical protein
MAVMFFRTHFRIPFCEVGGYVRRSGGTSSALELVEHQKVSETVSGSRRIGRCR